MGESLKLFLVECRGMTSPIACGRIAALDSALTRLEEC